MNLSLMSFSFIPEVLGGVMDAQLLCKVIKNSGLDSVDLLDVEVKMYGEEALQQAMAEAGVKLGCLICNASFYREPEKVEEQLTAALQQAKRLDAPILMVVPGSAEDEALCSGYTKEQMLKQAVVHYRKAVALAADYGIHIGLENTPQHFKPLASVEDCLYVLERVPGLGFIYDTANMKVADVLDDEVAYYEKVKDYIIRVHLKDVVITDHGKMEPCANGQKLSAVLLGSGNIRLDEILRCLKRDHYAGGIAMEYMAEGITGEGHTKMLKACCRYVRECWNEQRMLPPYSIIPGVDKPVSKIFFGTAIFPIMMGNSAHALFDAVFAQGMNAFDCARGYGMAENMLGNWIKDRDNREKVVLLTKCGNAGPQGVHIDRQVIETELQTSLAALQTDYIDIFLLHRDDPKTPVSEIIDTLNECVQQGKVRVFGASNWTHSRIAEANAYAESKGLQGFSVSSPNYGLAEQVEDPWGGDCITITGDVNADARAWYSRTQMPVLAYSSLARGFLSGKFKSFDYETAKAVMDPFAQKGYLHPCNMERLARAEQLAEKYDCTVAQIAMRYIFAGAMNVYALVSTTDPCRMRDNIVAAHHPLTLEEAEWLEKGD